MKDVKETNEALVSEAERICKALGLEAVRIIGTGDVEPHHSQCFTGGYGNWHAQYGAVAEIKANMDRALGAQAED